VRAPQPHTGFILPSPAQYANRAGPDARAAGACGAKFPADSAPVRHIGGAGFRTISIRQSVAVVSRSGERTRVPQPRQGFSWETFAQ